MSNSSTVATLDVLFRGDTSKLDSSLEKTEKGVKGFGDRLGKAGADGTEGWATKLTAISTTATAAMGAIALPMKVIGTAFSAITSTVGAVISTVTSVVTSIVERVASAIGTAVSTIASWAGTAFETAFGLAQQGVSRIVELVKRSIGDIDQLGRTAGLLNITTSALSGLQHAAAVMGLSTEQMSSALSHYQRTLSEAMQGSVEANKTFLELGVSARDLAGLPLEDQLSRIADRLKETGTQGDKLRLGMALLGKGGRELLPLFLQGSQELDRLRAQARAFGVTVNEVSTGEVRDATLAWAEYNQALVGVGRSLTVALAPLAQWLAKGASEKGAWLAGLVKDAMPQIRAAAQAVTSVLEEISAAIREKLSGLADGLGDWGTRFAAFVGDNMPLIRAGIETASVAFDTLKSAAGSALSTIGGWLVSLGESLGLWGGKWETTSTDIARSLYTLQFGFQNWQQYASLAFDKLLLAGTSFWERWKVIILGIQQGMVIFVQGFALAVKNMLEIAATVPGLGLPFEGLSLEIDGIIAEASQLPGAIRDLFRAMDQFEQVRPRTFAEQELIARIQQQEQLLAHGLDNFLSKKMRDFEAARAGVAKELIDHVRKAEEALGSDFSFILEEEIRRLRDAAKEAQQEMQDAAEFLGMSVKEMMTFLGSKANPWDQIDKPKVNGLGSQVFTAKPAAMEIGSKEAFSAIYGNEDGAAKQLNALNDQLREQREMKRLLQQLVQKGGLALGKARL